MFPLYNTNHLVEYSKQLDRQREVLKLSTVFSPVEKIEVLEAMNQLETIVNRRLSNLKDIEDATKL